MTKAELSKALAVTAEVVGATLTDAALEAMTRELSGYPAPAVVAALKRCQRECRGRLALADVLERGADGHAGPEEAWALVAQLGEEDTVVWTDQIARAWGAAHGLDRVAGRMAFAEIYRREVAEARAHGEVARWWVSLGEDPSQRATVLAAAVAARRLTPAEARPCLPLSFWDTHPELTAGAPALPAAPDEESRHVALAALRELRGAILKRAETPS